MADESIDQLARRLAESVPQGIHSLREDLEKNFRSVLRAGLGKLDLVTREEFEVQEAVLARTREMFSELEKRLAAVEKKATKKTTKSTAAKPREAPAKKATKSKRPSKKA
jgi:BMFP domain-containing protein YqiC